MKKMSLYAACAALAAGMLLAVSCSSREAVGRKELTSQESYEIARKLLDKKDYERAKLELKTVVRRFPNSAVADRALLDLAVLYLEIKEYTQTEHELKRLMRDYPDSPLAEDAQYYLGLSFYKQSASPALDQKETRYAIDEFTSYLRAFPQGKYAAQARETIALCREKLARKEYETAQLYFRQKDYRSAIIYCTTVLADYADTAWKEKAVGLLGQSEIKLKERQ